MPWLAFIIGARHQGKAENGDGKTDDDQNKRPPQAAQYQEENAIHALMLHALINRAKASICN